MQLLLGIAAIKWCHLKHVWSVYCEWAGVCVGGTMITSITYAVIHHPRARPNAVVTIIVALG